MLKNDKGIWSTIYGPISHELMQRGCLVFIDYTTTPATISRTKETLDCGILLTDVVSHGGDPVKDEAAIHIGRNSVMLRGWCVTDVITEGEQPYIGDYIYYNKQTRKFTSARTKLMIARLRANDDGFWMLELLK